MPKKPGTLFCFGLGYSAGLLARRLISKGWRVKGTCQSDKKAQALRSEGIEVFVFNSQMSGNREWLKGATHIVTSVPPKENGDSILELFGEHIAHCTSIQWSGYLSTTGVYGNTEGAWVDESSPIQADVKRSQYRAAAEQAWLQLYHDYNLPIHIFRLAGIYGPGRSPLDRIRRGQARRIIKPGHRFSRIHVEAIATVLEASMQRPNPGQIYNVCDDHPEEPSLVTQFGCKLLGIPPPPLISFEQAAKDMSNMGLSFWNDNRRVKNTRIKEELGVRLAYPTYKEGLRALAYI